ncbi:MAG: cytochrome ubiquinol oxidase subunit I [Calditrichaeota bacterium]|nr:MAG: cytochrome ubiquinol oxidase subunit I [Calditrichota bacterium]
MEDLILYHRLQFAFTISFHYLFPQLTMGLSALIVWFKWRYIRTGDELYNRSSLFWAKIFAVNFVLGVVTGIPMEFQFGTNWAKFSELTGNIIGQTLAMEGMFSFFLESTFLGLFLFAEKKLSPKMHFLMAFLVFAGTQASGLFIIATHSWMQHPVGYEILENGTFVLKNFSALFANSWLWPSYLHNQMASMVTSAFVMSGVGAFYMLNKNNSDFAKLFLKTGVVTGLVSSTLVIVPFGDMLAQQVARHQPITLSAMEGLFKTQEGAPMVLIGQPNMHTRTIDNKIELPYALSLLTYKRWNAHVKGLDAYDEADWPTNVPALYYAYHIMVGLGTIFLALMGLATYFLRKKRLFEKERLLWALLLAVPFPYIANLAGWYTAELGRQPWLVYGLLRTVDGVSATVSAGNTLFTLLGFIGLYFLLGVFFLLLVGKIIKEGPARHSG